MSERAMSAPAGALEAKNAQTKAFKKKGIMFAVASGMFYGLYTAFMTQGMDAGIWLNWYGGAVSVFATIYTLSAFGAVSYTHLSEGECFRNSTTVLTRSAAASPESISLTGESLSLIHICGMIEKREHYSDRMNSRGEIDDVSYDKKVIF